ncbi:hypothetical protein [Tractidigestivibacter scatoligenes]|uniref:hypothetical protein n=1 Tax=Tractidigestivibacter scatoligenes TaxID=1299998 RepID=UPI000ACC8F1F|nr:hypothetical protein [Tractidigestivibacter scatoligenes]
MERQRVPPQPLREHELPGQIYGSQRGAYIGRAQLWYDRMGAGGAASASPAPTVPSPDIDALAREVIAGKYGNGDDRRRALGANYGRVQARVNEILGAGARPHSQVVDVDALARAVIRGEFGNGEERKRRLGANYAAVQRRVNELLS